MAKKIHNAHDHFFKSVLSDKELAQEFLTHFLPKGVVALLDVKALEPQDYSYNNAELKAIFSDIIFNVPLKSSSNKFCQVSVLLEHKSSKDPYTAFQLLQYIASGYMKQIENNMPLSPILPVVYYHGKQPWAFQSISDHFDTLHDKITPYIPDIATHFIDLVGMSDKELEQLQGTFIYTAVLSQKYSLQPKELARHLHRIFHTFSDSKKNYYKKVVVYIMHNIDLKEADFKALIEDVPQNFKEDMISTYDQIKSKYTKKGLEEGTEKGIVQGIKKGIKQNKIDMILNGYKEKIPVDVLARLTELTPQEVEKIFQEHRG